MSEDTDVHMQSDGAVTDGSQSTPTVQWQTPPTWRLDLWSHLFIEPERLFHMALQPPMIMTTAPPPASIILITR